MATPTYTARETTALDQANNPKVGGRSQRARDGFVKPWPWAGICRGPSSLLYFSLVHSVFLCSEPIGTLNMEPVSVFRMGSRGHGALPEGCV